MRKIISKSEQEKKRKRNLMVIGIILIFVMFGSVFGVVIGSLGQGNSNKKMEYNGYEFFNENGLWKVSIGDADFIFKHYPTETKNITNVLKNVNNYYDKPLYVYSENLESEIEVYTNLQQIAARIQPACFSKEKCDGDFPIKTCSDNFIIISEGEEEITQDENCVYIKGEKQKLLELTDSFLYNIFGVK